MADVTGFPYVADHRARILILGSMPGVASLRQQAYYAHPRNAFWPIMQALFSIPAEQAYADRLQGLITNRIALWDVAHQCHRPGSMDADIQLETVQVNDFKGLFDKCPELALVCFNGGKAAELYKRLVLKSQPALAEGINYLQLPSTSPANARYSVAQKVDQWRQILDYLD